jgi:hypothetical protein
MTIPKPVLRSPCPAECGSDFQNFNSRLHLICTDGCFYGPALAGFKTCPTLNLKVLEELFRYEVFEMLKSERKINDVINENMMNPADGGVRYYGYYSYKSRDLRKKAGTDSEFPALIESEVSSKEFRKNWARLIQKIYHVDPLLCPVFGSYEDNFIYR